MAGNRAIPGETFRQNPYFFAPFQAQVLKTLEGLDFTLIVDETPDHFHMKILMVLARIPGKTIFLKAEKYELGTNLTAQFVADRIKVLKLNYINLLNS